MELRGRKQINLRESRSDPEDSRDRRSHRKAIDALHAVRGSERLRNKQHISVYEQQIDENEDSDSDRKEQRSPKRLRSRRMIQSSDGEEVEEDEGIVIERKRFHPVDPEILGKLSSSISGTRLTRRKFQELVEGDGEVDGDEERFPDGGRSRAKRHAARSETIRKNERTQNSSKLDQTDDLSSGSASDSNQATSDEEGSESDQESRFARKYPVRQRRVIKPDNVQTLGGDGGGLSKSRSVPVIGSRDLRRSEESRPIYVEPRRNFGGKIPNPAYYKNQKRSRHGRRRSNDAMRRHFDSSSDSSDSSNDRGFARNRSPGYRRDSGDACRMRSCDQEDDQFVQYERRRLQEERDSVMPIDMNHTTVGGSVQDKASKRDLMRADVAPLAVDSRVGFSCVGGLEGHIDALKEMIVLPLLYPQVFARFDTQPPRGVLFVGPPGTGKTLTARALANSIAAGSTKGGRKISFFMRKGADCLSKWVGEGERQLRLLFEQAKKFQPSIIFFDEIDGLAPVRSVKQDQIHASIVSTLLALMDGLDSRGQVVVIGATNRPDAIDSALRRPGRFDRELAFPLPDALGRRAILDIHTQNWNPPLDENVKAWIVANTSGYCGADIKAFCAEAALISLRRAYPQVYSSDVRLSLDPSTLVLRKGDFAAAMKKIVPSSRRVAAVTARPLDILQRPLLERYSDLLQARVREIFPAASAISRPPPRPQNSKEELLTIRQDSDEWVAALTDANEALRTSNSELVEGETWLWDEASLSYFPRLLVCGKVGMGQAELAAGVLHFLESVPSQHLDLASLVGDTSASSPEQALVTRVQEAYRHAPAVIFLPDLRNWWMAATDAMKSALTSMRCEAPPSAPVLWLGYAVVDDDQIRDSDSPETDQRYIDLLLWLSSASPFSKVLRNGLTMVLSSKTTFLVAAPNHESRLAYFRTFLVSIQTLPQKVYSAHFAILTSRAQALLPHTTAEAPVQVDEGIDATEAPREGRPPEHDNQCLRELRTFFRAALSELMKEKRCHAFVRPVDPELVPDYYDVITNPMDLETMRMKVDDQLYPTLDSFLLDIRQIVANAMEYNPLTREDVRGRSIVHSAHGMVDLVESHAYHFKKEIGYDLFRDCEEINRRTRPRKDSCPEGNSSSTGMPKENLKYYAHILREHERLKQENSDDEQDHHSVAEKPPRELEHADESSDAEEQQSRQRCEERRISRRSLRGSDQVKEEELLSLDDIVLKKKRKSRTTVTEDVTTHAASSSTVHSVQQPVHSENDRTDQVEGGTDISSSMPENALPIILTENDIESCPKMIVLQKSIKYAQRNSLMGFATLLCAKTEGWSVDQLCELMSGLNAIFRKFQSHGDFAKSCQELKQLVDSL